MTLRRVRAVSALTFLTLAVAVPAATGVSQAATTSPPTSPASLATTPRAKLSIRLLQVPTSEANNPRALTYIIDRLAPGTVIHRQFQITNAGNDPLHVSVYPAAAIIGNGGFQFAAGRTQNEMTTWIRISQPTANLAAHQSATLVATVAVPRDAPSGEQYGVLWAEQDTKGTGNVTLASRVGIRLYLSIGAGGAPASNFTLGTPTISHTPGGSPVIHVPVHNTGGRAVDVHGTLQLTGGPGGLQAGPFTATAVNTLAPGQSYPEIFTLSSHIPDGPWQATVTLTSGLITQTEKVTLNLADTTVSSANMAFPVIPVAAGAGAVILLAAAGLLLVRRRRRTPPPGTTSTPAEQHLSR